MYVCAGISLSHRSLSQGLLLPGVVKLQLLSRSKGSLLITMVCCWGRETTSLSHQAVGSLGEISVTFMQKSCQEPDREAHDGAVPERASSRACLLSKLHFPTSTSNAKSYLKPP